MTDKQEIKLPDPAYEIAMHESFECPRPIPYLGYDRLPVGTKLYTGEAIRSLIERLEAAEAQVKTYCLERKPQAQMISFEWLVWKFEELGLTKEADAMRFHIGLYQALQLENSTAWGKVWALEEAAKSAGELQAVDHSPQVPAPERLHPLHDPRPDAGLVSGGVPFGVPPAGMEHQGNDASPGHQFNGGGQAGGSGVSGGLEAGRSGHGGLAEGVSDGSSS